MYTFMKTKQKASDPPEWVKERDGHETYIRQYHEKEGILLEKGKSDSGHIQMAKLCLDPMDKGPLADATCPQAFPQEGPR